MIKALLALERHRAGAGELEGGDVELQRAGGADLDAVGGVEVVDDEGAPAPLKSTVPPLVLIWPVDLVVDVVVDLQRAGARGLEGAANADGAVEAVLDRVGGVENERAADRLDQAVVLQRQIGDRAEAGDLIAVVVEDVGGGDAR